MLTAEGCRGRRERLWNALPGPCDLLIVSDPAHLAYLAGFEASPFTFRSARSGAILVLRPDRATLVGDNLIRPDLEASQVDEVVAPTWYEGKRAAPDRLQALVEAATAVARRGPRGRVGVEPASVPSGLAEGIGAGELFDLRPILLALRRSKDPDEIETIRRSAAAIDAGMAAGLAEVAPGMSELEAYQRIARAAIARLGEPAIVYGDFASGPRTEQGGGPPTGRIIEEGDLFLLDFSVVVRGYRGDFANTFAVGRSPTDEQAARFEACLAAIAAGEALLRPGVAAEEVDRAVRGTLDDRALGRFSSHSGHGLGLGHPESPFIVPEGHEALFAGDVVTLEPSLFVEGKGGVRYERNYLVTPAGFELLSGHELRIDPGRPSA